jgi:hypothetical protein
VSEYRRQIVIASVVGVVIVLSIGIGIYYIQPQLGSGTTSVTTGYSANFPQSAQTTSSTSGLELMASVNTTSIQHGQAIQVSVEVFNTITKANNVSGASNWYLNDMNPSLLLGPGNLSSMLGFTCFAPANFVIFKGDYGSGNLSSIGSPLVLYGHEMATPSCHKSNFDLYVFQPYSGEANVSLTTPPNYNYTINMQASSAILSYCNIPPGAEGVCFSGFSPGVYTIAAGDEWGQLLLLHFVVTNSVTTTSSTNSISTYSTYTNTMYTASSNINLSDYCPPVSAGGFEFRLVSDSTGTPVNPDSISAVNMLTCNGENQVATINEFSYIGGGWIVPVFPQQAMYGGGLNITVTYQGKTYNFAGAIPPIGTDCVTLIVPSGNVSFITVMNGSGSYCSQSSTSSSSSNSNYSTLGVSSCSETFSNGTSTGEDLYLAQLSGSTAKLCVRYFYYNTTLPISLNSLRQLTIYAPVQSSGTLRNADSSFLVSADVSQVQIGGPQQENEGVLVSYTIKSIGSAPSGTYEIALSSILYPKDIACGDGIYMTFQVGNATNPVVGTSCHYDPTPQSNPGVVYSEIVGITNSTQ